jgi:hypothetical protein
MQIVFYNDGQEGRNRYIVQLANVRSESHYGITAVPDYGTDESEPPPEVPDVPAGPIEDVVQTPEPEADTALPQEPVYEEYDLSGAVPAADTLPLSLPAPGRPLLERVLRTPAALLKNVVRLLVNKPGEFALLFALWALLGAPVYLALRRRSFARTIAT